MLIALYILVLIVRFKKLNKWIGIILYEMLNTFKTSMEKYENIDAMKRGIFSEEFTKEYKYEITLIQKLIEEIPEYRVLTGDILGIKILFKE